MFCTTAVTQLEACELLALQAFLPLTPVSRVGGGGTESMLLVSKLRVTIPHPVAPLASPDPVPPSDAASSAQSLNTPSAPLSVHALPSAVCGQPLFLHTRRRWHPRSLSYPPDELVPTFPSIHVALGTSYCVTGVHCVALALDWPHPCSLRTHSGPCPEQASGTFVRLSDVRGEPVPSTPSVPPGTGSWTLLRCTLAGPTRGTQLCTTPPRSTSTAW